MSDIDLRGAKLFAGLPEKDVKKMSAQFKEVTHLSGKKLTVTGEHGVGFMVILSGEAEVHTHDGRVRKLGPGDSFGEMALLSEGERSADVTAVTDVHMAGIPEWDFKSFLIAHPEVCYRMLQATAQRLRESEES